MEPEVTNDSLPPEPEWSSTAASVFVWAQQHLPPTQGASQRSIDALAQQQLEQELAGTRAELTAMQELMEDIPLIFERKFQQRLQPVLEDNANLKRQLLQLQGGAQTSQQPLLPPARRKPRLHKALRHAFGLPAWERRHPEDDDAAAA